MVELSAFLKLLAPREGYNGLAMEEERGLRADFGGRGADRGRPGLDPQRMYFFRRKGLVSVGSS